VAGSKEEREREVEGEKFALGVNGRTCGSLIYLGNF
jgi:hypothetical protein